ncbi:hypothetical protein FRC06_007740 [Ceratobasidium sp. 370]|nr:hypothetical protein FRC06_007740 [Ceratobasidium sp. 370]
MPADRDDLPESEEPKLMGHGRQMMQLGDMYRDMEKILALVKKWQRMTAEQRESYEASSSDERKRQLALVKEFVRLEPTMLTQICSVRRSEASTALAYASKMLAKGQTNCQSEDAQKVRVALASWRKWNPPLDPKDKASRGLNHQGTGFELLTLDIGWNNIEERTKFMSDGDPPMDEFSLGHFCYANGEGDKRRPWVNVFQGDLLLKGTEAILFSPKVSKSNLDMDAKKYDVKEITAPFIAYVVVMVQQALTSDETFQEVCLGFDYTVFYDELTQVMEQELLGCYPAGITGSSQAEQRQHGMLAALDAALAPGGELAGEADAGAGEADADAGE